VPAAEQQYFLFRVFGVVKELLVLQVGWHNLSCPADDERKAL
jgi:hypothetical protein